MQITETQSSNVLSMGNFDELHRDPIDRILSYLYLATLRDYEKGTINDMSTLSRGFRKFIIQRNVLYGDNGFFRCLYKKTMNIKLSTRDMTMDKMTNEYNQLIIEAVFYIESISEDGTMYNITFDTFLLYTIHKNMYEYYSDGMQFVGVDIHYNIPSSYICSKPLDISNEYNHFKGMISSKNIRRAITQQNDISLFSVHKELNETNKLPQTRTRIRGMFKSVIIGWKIIVESVNNTIIDIVTSEFKKELKDDTNKKKEIHLCEYIMKNRDVYKLTTTK